MDSFSKNLENAVKFGPFQLGLRAGDDEIKVIGDATREKSPAEFLQQVS